MRAWRGWSGHGRQDTPHPGRNAPPIRLLALLLLLAFAAPALAQEAYVSPYWLRFTVPLSVLTGDFEVEPRASIEQQSFEPPFARWSDPSAYGRGASWGPRARTWPPPSVPPGVDPLTWRRERLLAVARRYLGYDYQHHHIPDWLPPPDWPSRTERRSRGLDCSNFTSWVYNYGLGIRITSNVRQQAEIEGLRLEGDYPTLRRTLETGDLLFMRGQDGISHVVMWVGAAGQPADEPLVVDSTSNVRTDSRGARIPAGIHLRPFREGSWYHRSFSHALRLVL